MKMTWETYAYIRSFLELEKERFEKEYLIALSLLTLGRHMNAKEDMRITFMNKVAEINKMLEQLKYAAGMSQGPNASKEMKEFWGINI